MQLSFTPIHKRTQLFKLNKADLIYLDLANVDAAIDQWLLQLNDLFHTIKNLALPMQRATRSTKSAQTSLVSYSIHKSIKIAHKILYACLANYRLKKLIRFINSHFPCNLNSENSTNNQNSNSRDG